MRFSFFFTFPLVVLCLLASACAPRQAQAQIGEAVYGPPNPALTGPAVRVTLSRPFYKIRVDAKTGAPQMPKDVVAQAEVVNWPPGAPPPDVFLWHAFLDWDFAPYPTHHSISERVFTQPSPFQIPLEEQVRGGTLTVYAKTTLNGKEIYGKAQSLVLGENPPREMVLKAFPPSRFGLMASKICMAESELHQFTEPSGMNPGGMPLLSRTNDIGLMQLNAPTGSITSADEVWDWRANVGQGLMIMQGKRQNTVLASRHATDRTRQPDPVLGSAYQTWNLLNLLRDAQDLPPLSEPVIPPLSDAPNSGMLPDEPDPDHLQLSQVERDAIRRYNGGQEYVFQIIPDVTTLDILWEGWQVDPTRGGIRPNTGDPNYVQHVLDARSGFKLPPPPMPRSTPTKTTRSHRRGHK
ncbi:MAG TPA: hypothetical protein VKU00_09730 [Chthonomonadaceae bacterium]|nr:hypothetical protein [Chthonomonadaceae bacterium]